jgi:hypothetical protein
MLSLFGVFIMDLSYLQAPWNPVISLYYIAEQKTNERARLIELYPCLMVFSSLGVVSSSSSLR